MTMNQAGAGMAGSRIPDAARAPGSIRQQIETLHTGLSEAEALAEQIERARNRLIPATPRAVSNDIRPRQALGDGGANVAPAPNTVESELGHLQTRLSHLLAHLGGLAAALDQAI